MLEILEITDNKKTNNFIKIAVVGAGIYYGSRILKDLNLNSGSFTNPFGGTGQSVPNSCGLTIFRRTQIEKLGDDWYSSFSGPNFFVYPEISNQILPYNQCEMEYFVNYYTTNYGTHPYTLLEGEWQDFDGEYQNALDHMESLGFKP